MKKSLCHLILLLASLTPEKVTALPPSDVRLVFISGENGLTFDEAIYVYKTSSLFIKENLGVELALSKVKRSKVTRCAQYNTPEFYTRMATCWKGYLSRRSRHTNKLHILILPPIVGDGLYIGGASISTCQKRSSYPLAFVSVKEISWLTHSIVALTHEILHLLGASHDNSLPATIMNEAALDYVDPSCPLDGCLDLSEKSTLEIYNCMEGLNDTARKEQ